MPSTKLPQLIIDMPFENGIVIPERMRWSASSVKLWRTCKRKWFWTHLMGIRPKARAGSLVVGGAFHEGLARFYQSKRSTMGKVAESVVKEAEDEVTRNRTFYNQTDYDKMTAELAMLRGMLRGYAAAYGNDDRKMWTIDRKLIECRFEIDMGEFDYVGFIDGIVTSKKRRKVLEHKTASKIGTSYVERLPMDTQVRSYIMGATSLGVRPTEVIYNVVKKSSLRRKSDETAESYAERIELDYAARPDFYFWREELKFRRGDIEALKFELHQVHKEFMAYASGDFGDPYDPRTWLANDGACYEFFSTCHFMDLCQNGLDRGTGARFVQKGT